MASYVVPQVEIHQLFSEIPVALTQNQVSFVFGPNYLLHRYGVAAEKSGTYAGEYSVEDENGKFYAYPNVLDEDKVETSYTKVFMDNALVAIVGSFDEPLNASFVTSDNGTSDSSDDYVVPDQVDLDWTGQTASTAEVSVGRKLLLRAAGVPSITAEIVRVVSVNEETNTVRVQIDEELPDPSGFMLSSAILCEVRDGIEITRRDYTDSDMQRFNWTEDKGAAVVSGTPRASTRAISAEAAAALENPQPEVKGIKVRAGLEVPVADTDINPTGVKLGEILYADVYITYRELVAAAADTIHSITYATEVTEALGAVSPDNPLAQAVYDAALNSGGQLVRYMAVPTDDKEGYEKVLNAATLTKEVYFLVPVTRDSAILDLVQSHVDSMSAPTVKRWRIAFVSADIPEVDPIYTSTVNTDGSDFKAVVFSVDAVKKTADVAFLNAAGDGFNRDTRFTRDVKVDDRLYYKYHEEWGETVPYNFKIVAVPNKYTVRVEDPDGRLVQNFVGKAEIYHPYTNAEKAEVIRNLSSSFSDRRMYNVFPSVFSAGGVQMTGEFAAACVAGLVSSCLPQQPVTNLELVGIDDVPLVYQTFSYDELNTMASGGTFIVMQDLPNDQVYVRHQISTAYEDNNLNTAELSITKNLDSISYFFDDLCSPYIGKYNITPELLNVLRGVITGGLTKLEGSSYGLYGPQLIADGTSILLLEQDAVLKDHVNCNLQLNMPYPFNHLVLKLFV